MNDAVLYHKAIHRITSIKRSDIMEAGMIRYDSGASHALYYIFIYNYFFPKFIHLLNRGCIAAATKSTNKQSNR